MEGLRLRATEGELTWGHFANVQAQQADSSLKRFAGQRQRALTCLA
jgi:hypothetical protein